MCAWRVYSLWILLLVLAAILEHVLCAMCLINVIQLFPKLDKLSLLYIFISEMRKLRLGEVKSLNESQVPSW